MHMVFLNVQFNHLASGKSANRLDTIVNSISYGTHEYSKTIFWNPNNVVLTMPYRM